VPQKTAIDFIDGRKYLFTGDSSLVADDFSRNFHLKPSRILHRIENTSHLNDLISRDNLYMYHHKRVMMIDKPVSFAAVFDRPVIDLLIISKNPRMYMKSMAAALDIKHVVFDGSVPEWKSVYWKKDCDSLKIPWHDVKQQGAFEMNVKK
jgi:competence protein ComEC